MRQVFGLVKNSLYGKMGCEIPIRVLGMRFSLCAIISFHLGKITQNHSSLNIDFDDDEDDFNMDDGNDGMYLYHHHNFRLAIDLWLLSPTMPDTPHRTPRFSHT
ncbi:hypothetical protein CsSME_00000654 [Camellia sinensis var. sinensis]